MHLRSTKVSLARQLPPHDFGVALAGCYYHFRLHVAVPDAGGGADDDGGGAGDGAGGDDDGADAIGGLYRECHLAQPLSAGSALD